MGGYGAVVSRRRSYEGRTRAGYDAVAETYAAQFADELAGKPLDRALLAALAEQAPPGPAADLGCGPGQAAVHLRGHGRPVVAMDLAPGMGLAARRRAPGLPFAAGSLLALPLQDASVAAITCLYAVIHLEPGDLPTALGEMRRVLLPGGLVLLSFHVGEEVRHVDEWFGADVDLDFRFLRPAVVTSALEGANLDVRAVVERAAYAEEVQTRRCYLLAGRPE